jgi:hypothetical protein
MLRDFVLSALVSSFCHVRVPEKEREASNLSSGRVLGCGLDEGQ